MINIHIVFVSEKLIIYSISCKLYVYVTLTLSILFDECMLRYLNVSIHCPLLHVHIKWPHQDFQMGVVGRWGQCDLGGGGGRGRNHFEVSDVF